VAEGLVGKCRRPVSRSRRSKTGADKEDRRSNTKHFEKIERGRRGVSKHQAASEGSDPLIVNPYYSAYGAKLHAVDETIMGKNVGDDDELIARLDAALALKEADGILNGVVGIGTQRHDIGHDAAQESEMAECLCRIGYRVDRGLGGAKCGDCSGHKPAPREGENGTIFDLIGQ
jgi:hypothetical protein